MKKWKLVAPFMKSVDDRILEGAGIFSFLHFYLILSTKLNSLCQRMPLNPG